MMLGILVPGLLMIFLQVHPLVLITELGLIAAAILFATGSITPADLKGLRRGSREKAAAEPEVVKAVEARPQAKAGAGTSRFREITRAVGNLAALIRERWQTARKGKTHVDAIDRALDRTITPPSAQSPPAPARIPVPGESRAGSRGPGGDPFQDLLNANFEPVLLEAEIPGKDVVIPAKNVEIPGKDGTTPGVMPQRDMEKKPLIPATGPRKEATTVKGPTVKVESVKAPPAPGPAAVPPAAPTRPAMVPEKGTFEIPLKEGKTISQSIAALPTTGGTPSPAKGTAPSPPTVSITVTETSTAATTPEATGAGQAADPEILSFTSEPGGTMDDLLATLREDESRVKRSDDSSLLRKLKGVRVQGEELVDDLSSLLKEIQ